MESMSGRVSTTLCRHSRPLFGVQNGRENLWPTKMGNQKWTQTARLFVWPIAWVILPCGLGSSQPSGSHRGHRPLRRWLQNRHRMPRRSTLLPQTGISRRQSPSSAQQPGKNKICYLFIIVLGNWRLSTPQWRNMHSCRFHYGCRALIQNIFWNSLAYGSHMTYSLHHQQVSPQYSATCHKVGRTCIEWTLSNIWMTFPQRRNSIFISTRGEGFYIELYWIPFFGFLYL